MSRITVGGYPAHDPRNVSVYVADEIDPTSSAARVHASPLGADFFGLDRDRDRSPRHQLPSPAPGGGVSLRVPASGLGVGASQPDFPVSPCDPSCACCP